MPLLGRTQVLSKHTLTRRPLSHSGHFESQENKKLCFCPSSLALDKRSDGQNLLFHHRSRSIDSRAGRNEPRPFFHFWRHPFCPKFASPILNLCRRKTSFQWCPDQGDWPNGARVMHKNAQIVEWKTRSKNTCHYTWLLHRKNCPCRWRFLRSFLTPSKPSRRSITAAKRKEKEKKERRKKISKNEKPKDVGQFWFLRMPESEVIKRDASGETSEMLCCRRIFDHIKANLVEIQPENHQNVQKTRGSMG